MNISRTIFPSSVFLFPNDRLKSCVCGLLGKETAGVIGSQLLQEVGSRQDQLTFISGKIIISVKAFGLDKHQHNITVSLAYSHR